MKKWKIFGVCAIVTIMIATNFINMVKADVTDISAPTDKIEYWGVVIGIGDYKGEGHDIPLNKTDLSSIYNALLIANNWNKNHIKLLLDENATRNAILDALDWLRKNADSDDIILFSFLGHGDQTTDKNGDEKDGYDEGIVPWEGMEGFITDDELGKKFNEINAKGMCLIFDCCLSGGVVDNSLKLINPEIWLKEFTNDIDKNNRVILASTPPNGLGGSLQIKNPLTNRTWSSFFSKWVAKAFEKGYDFNRDGVVSAEEAFYFAKIRILPFAIFLLNPIWQLKAIVQTGHPILAFPQIYDGYNGPLPIVIK